MSYTPEDEKIIPALDRFLGSLDELRAIMLRRLKNAEWSTEHRLELTRYVGALTELETDLRTHLEGKTR
jgi:hypothetical protein